MRLNVRVPGGNLFFQVLQVVTESEALGRVSYYSLACTEQTCHTSGLDSLQAGEKWRAFVALRKQPEMGHGYVTWTSSVVGGGDHGEVDFL